MNKTAKEWIASVKDPVIKRYLEENVSDFIIDGEFPTFCNFIDGCFYSPETKQGDDFWYYVSQNNPSTLSYSDFKHLDKSVQKESLIKMMEQDEKLGMYDETQLKEDKEKPKMDKLQHPTAFRKEWMKNNAHVVNTEHHELLLMKAYALYYHDYKTRSVEQPKVSVNEDHRCTNYDPFGNCNCTQEVSVNEDAVKPLLDDIL
jgi:hypothetical protein